MAIPPKYSGAILNLSSSASPHTLELYLDYVCPFSAKQFLFFQSTVVPMIKSKYSKSGPGLQIVFRQAIQPWHPSSTLVHEAGLAVLRLCPDKFYQFSKTLFERQKEYFDEAVANEGRNTTYKRLAELVESSTGADKEEVYRLLQIRTDTGEVKNAGNELQADVKYTVKEQRLRGVHVTPTVVFNGLVEGSISSSWGKDEWEEWLEKNIV